MTATRRFAEGTVVPLQRSRAEIEVMLTRYGATSFASGFDNDKRCASVMFVVRGRRVRFELQLPDPKSKEFTHETRRPWISRPASKAQELYDAELRRLWRSLALVIKAKLEAVESGVTTFDDEFLAHFIASDGRTIGETLRGQLDALSSGSSRLLLPASEAHA